MPTDIYINIDDVHIQVSNLQMRKAIRKSFTNKEKQKQKTRLEGSN